ncbi:MAG: PP2C family serine/threonine-protein phosphatase [Chloroflexota bacterium]
MIVSKLEQPGQWQQWEPPFVWQDRVPHTDSDLHQGADGWLLMGASRRGRLHAHEATFREDAFQIAVADDWHFAAVADGAGSCSLSRVGATQAVQTALTAMQARLINAEPSQAIVHSALSMSLECAWHTVYQEALHRQSNRIYFQDFSTTLLLLAFHSGENLVGIAQVGDGLIAAQFEDNTIRLFGEPDSGEYAGQTHFLTSYSPDTLSSKADTFYLDSPAHLFMVMTDGLSDDLFPPQKKLSGLIKPLPKVCQQDQPEEALLSLLNYERAGSFDDRTLVVLCQSETLQSPKGR